MAHKPQSEDIPKEELPHFLNKFNILRRFVFLSPDGFLEGDNFGLMLMQAYYVKVYMFKNLFFFRHGLSIKDNHKLRLTKAVNIKII